LLRLGRESCLRHDKLSGYLGKFLDAYVTKLSKKSEIAGVRAEIRSSKKLGLLLWDNRVALKQIYEAFEHPRDGFSLEAADALLNGMESAGA